jgi:putative efflux protein, MATE family
MKTINFSQGNIKNNILQMYIPLYIAYFCSALYDIIGSFWVGSLLGEKALAAMSASFPCVMLFSALAMGATNGVTIILSRYLGEKNKEKINSTLATSLIGLFVFGVLLMVGCIIGINGILMLGNTPGEIFQTARTYLFIRILSFPFIELYMYFAAVLRSHGNSSMQMIAVILSTVLNIVLDPILIIQIGINGAALATLLAQIISMLIMIRFILVRKIVRFDIKTISLETLKEIANASVPSAIQQSIPTISIAFIQSLFSSFGVVPLAAFGVVSKLEIIVQYPGLTINMTETTAIGTCYGARQNDRIKDYLRWGIVISVCLNLVLTPLVTIFSTNLAGLFGVSTSAILIVKTYFEIIAAGYLFNCITNSIMGEMNGLGQQTRSMILMAIYFIVIRFPLAKVLSSTTLGINGASISILISYAAAVIIAVVYEFTVLNHKIQSENDLILRENFSESQNTEQSDLLNGIEEYRKI